ncbi:MAG: YEATS-associated helix-containing protein [Nannocystales bacterium]
MLLFVLGGGGLGALASRSIPPRDPPPRWRDEIGPSLVAALSVPVFLQLGQSPLVDESLQADWSSMVVLLGLCALAGTSSRTFISQVSRTALGQAEEAKRVAEQAQKAANEVAVATVNASDTSTTPFEGANPGELSEGEQVMLSKFGTTTGPYLSLEDIGHLAGRDATLAELERRKLVGRLTVDGRPRYYLTKPGRSVSRGEQLGE